MGTKWWVPNTSDESSTDLDKLQVSLSDRILIVWAISNELANQSILNRFTIQDNTVKIEKKFQIKQCKG
jgi:hypothetical protein